MLSFWKHEMSEGWDAVLPRENLHVSASNLSDVGVYKAHDYPCSDYVSDQVSQESSSCHGLIVI